MKEMLLEIFGRFSISSGKVLNWRHTTHKPLPCLCTTKKRENTMCVGRKKVTENNLTRDPGTPTEGRANNHKNGRERKGVHIVVYRRENVAIIRSAKSIP